MARAAPAPVPRQAPRHVLDHDHRPVDDDPEVDRAQGEEVRGEAAELEIEKRAEQRERDDERHHQRGAETHQEDAHHEHDEERAEHQVVRHGGERAPHQPGAVVEGVDADAGREDAVVQLLDLGVQRVEDHGRVLPPAHEHDALDRLGLAVAGHHAAAGEGADRDARQVADADRDAAARRHHHLLDVPGAGERAEAAHHVLLLAVLDVVAAGVGVRAPERLVHLVQRDAARLQLLGVDLHLVLLHEAAEGDHVGDARHLLQMPLHHPVLELAQLHRRVTVADQRVAVDLAGRGRERAERRLHALGDVHLRQALARLLAGEVEVGAVVEGEHDEGEAEEGEGVHAHEPGEPVHLLLDRERHLPLDLLRGVAGEEGDDLDLRVGQLGEGLDGQVPEGDRPGDGEGHREPEDGDRLGEGKREDAAHRGTRNSKGGASARAPGFLGQLRSSVWQTVSCRRAARPKHNGVKRLTTSPAPARLTPS